MDGEADDTRTWHAHSSAEIESGAQIGERTRLWHQVHVRSGAVIGADCNIGKNVYIDAGVVIGNRVKVQNNVSVYHGVTVGDDVFLGPSCVFTNDRYPRASNLDWEVVPTVLGRGVSVGANATLICGITLDDWATIGSGAVVTHDVAAHQLVLGNPARPCGWVCKCGRVVSHDPSGPPGELRCGRCRESAGESASSVADSPS